MGQTRDERANLRKRRWAVIAARGKTRWVVVRGIFGAGISLTALTFLQEWLVDHSISGLRQISSDLLVRTPLCLLGGYFFGLLTWKWFSHRYGTRGTA
jgi:hypothetical protein